MKDMTRQWALTFAFSGLILLALAFGLTWVNIYRTDMAYRLRKLQTDVDSQSALISKLEVERDTLTTPDRLRELAGQYGLVQAQPGQVRRLSAAGEEMPSPVLATAAAAPEKARPQIRKPLAAKGKAAVNGKQAVKIAARAKGPRKGISGNSVEAEGDAVTIGAVKP